MEQRRITLHARNGLSVWACAHDDGRVSIEGQDLHPPIGNTYAYTLTVDTSDVGRMVEALGGHEGQDVLDLVQAHAPAIVRGGEMSWLHSLGIEPHFWSRIGD